MVVMQFFETVVRYADFFKVRKDCVVPTLESMVDARFASFPFMYSGSLNASSTHVSPV